MEDLESFDLAINAPPKDKTTQVAPEEVARAVFKQFIAVLPLLGKGPITELHSRLMSEILRRGMESEITGAGGDASKISLDQELTDLIRLTQQMRYNLTAQMASEEGASNREIQSTLKASIDTIKALTSHQEAIMTLERQRILEQVLLEVLGELSEQARQDFQKTLRERLEQVTKKS